MRKQSRHRTRLAAIGAVLGVLIASAAPSAQAALPAQAAPPAHAALPAQTAAGHSATAARSTLSTETQSARIPTVTSLDPTTYSQPSAASPLPEGARVAAAGATADAVISGSVVFEGADEFELGPNGLPSGDFFVEVWSADRRQLSSQKLESSRFRFDGLTAGAEYYLLFSPYSIEAWGAVWSGGSAVAVGARPVTAPAADATLTSSHPGMIKGEVSGLDTFWSVQAVYQDPTTKRLFAWNREQIPPKDGSASPYYLTGLPRGSYTVLAGAWGGGYDDRLWKDSRRAEGASFFPVGGGTTASGIDLSITKWDQWRWHTDRLSGSDRYATSVALTRSAFAPGIPVLYVASGENWPDALSAGPAAAVQGGALLMTEPGRLTSVVADEIRRLAPRRIVVVGSEATIVPSTYDAIAALAPRIERIGGRDRYETSRLLVAGVFDRDRRRQDALEVYLATGRNFPDALSASSVAAQFGSPVLLVDGAAEEIDDATTRTLSGVRASGFILVGGPTTITPGFEASMRSRYFFSSIERVAGRDRYATSALLFRQSALQDTVYLAAGATFPDALSGVASGAAQGSAVLLVEKDCVHQQTVDVMKGQSKNYATLLGSSLTLTRDVEDLKVCAA
ncbi:cell wall-binding repeat-containing protein [Rathayibacter sp. Leaf296]|uniref:cell wall-binding repeat-containing protein n=1 Tax=Rathayibacter sp. Leaf296 TaxID=1736327 RepID=UPI000703389E|nr:cell wall-binding repeat-containing protein [Rathayibacter sp. Leaf296]KQQ08349.1 hypothetical protein ASF46_13625 [Rathayibacter sp. Leaf296]